MDADTVRSYFNSRVVVDHYVRATANVGLWLSEEAVFTQAFPDKEATLLELGCGAGRISCGLWELGYRHLLGIDISSEMIRQARRINRTLEYGASFQTMDATALKFEDEMFDGAIFGFNGLMQVPRREGRQKAISEIFRTLRPGARFVFTAHDRDNPRRKSFWKRERKLWKSGSQKPELDEYGDIFEDTEMGSLFIHVPDSGELREDLKAVGFKVECDRLRSMIANEPPRVRDFSDDCRFWIARKP